MVYLYEDPVGEKIFSNNATAASVSGAGAGGLGGNPFLDAGSSSISGDSKLKASREKVANLEKKVQELELMLKEYQVIRKKIITGRKHS